MFNTKVTFDTSGMSRRMRRETVALTTDIAQMYVDDLKQVLDVPPERTGRMYGAHQASAPGEPPAPDTRTLVDSLRVESEWRGRTYSVDVVTDAEYAMMLEEGTSKMAPRPFLRSTLQENESKYRQEIARRRGE